MRHFDWGKNKLQSLSNSQTWHIVPPFWNVDHFRFFFNKLWRWRKNSPTLIIKHWDSVWVIKHPSLGLFRNFWSEVPTPAEKAGKNAQVSVLCLLWVVSISISHFCISRPSFRIPLNSTVFSILKFKIEIYKRSSMKLKHRFLRKYGVVDCSLLFQQFLNLFIF